MLNSIKKTLLLYEQASVLAWAPTDLQIRPLPAKMWTWQAFKKKTNKKCAKDIEHTKDVPPQVISLLTKEKNMKYLQL
jgi:hypothetical protein